MTLSAPTIGAFLLVCLTTAEHQQQSTADEATLRPIVTTVTISVQQDASRTTEPPFQKRQPSSYQFQKRSQNPRNHQSPPSILDAKRQKPQAFQPSQGQRKAEALLPSLIEFNENDRRRETQILPEQKAELHRDRQGTSGLRRDRTPLTKRINSPGISSLRDQKISTHITVGPPRPSQRIIRQRANEQRPHDLRSEQQRKEDLHDQSNSPLNTFPERKGNRSVSLKEKRVGLNPLQIQHFQQHQQQQPHKLQLPNHQQSSREFPRYQQIQQKRQQRPRANQQNPIFDVTRFSTSSPPEEQPRLLKQRRGNEGRFSLSPQVKSTNISEGSSRPNAPRRSKSIVFHLGNRGRGLNQRNHRDKNPGIRSGQSQGTRSRPLVRYVRPNNLLPHQNSTSTEAPKSSITELSTKIGNSDDKNDDWIPTLGPAYVATSTISSSTTVPPPTTTVPPILKSIGNITLSLQRARELFAKAQERYKALTTEVPKIPHNNETNVFQQLESEPTDDYSIPYPKIRHSDGTVSSIDLPEASESIAVTTHTSPNITAAIPETTEYSTIATPATTPLPPISAIYDEKNKPKDDINITTIEKQAENIYNSTIISKPAIPSPVYKNSPYSARLPSFQGFSSFGLGNVNQRQQSPTGLFQSSSSSTSANAGSQPSSVSNLFGLGSLPSFGGLGGNFGFGSSLGNLGGLGNFGLGQTVRNSNADSSQLGQQPGSGLGSLGYLGLLPGLGNLGIGQSSAASAPELSLSGLSQGNSGSQLTNGGLGFLSSIPSLNLGGLGSLGNIGGLGGSFPGLGNLGTASGGGSGIGGLTSLSSLGLGKPGGLSSPRGGSAPHLGGLSSSVGSIPGTGVLSSILGGNSQNSAVSPLITQASPVGNTAAVSPSVADALGTVQANFEQTPSDTKASSSSVDSVTITK